MLLYRSRPVQALDDAPLRVETQCSVEDWRGKWVGGKRGIRVILLDIPQKKREIVTPIVESLAANWLSLAHFHLLGNRQL